MKIDARNGRNEVPLDWVKGQLRALGAVEPPPGLRERLLAAIACRTVRRETPWHRHAPRWCWATGWVGLAAAVVVVWATLWFRTPAAPSVDVNSRPQRVLAVDHNGLRPPDTNALDSNGVY